MKKTHKFSKDFQRFVLLTLLFIGFSYNVAGQSPLWLRYPSISPDGKNVVFNFKGDLYKVNIEGGKAIQLTTHKAYDHKAVWSHDGKNIAFASNRYGNFDIFLISNEGGSPKRLTYNSSDDIPSDFAIDNKSIIFSSARYDTPNCMLFPTSRQPELYSVPIDAKRPRQIFTTPAWNSRYNSKGDQLIFEDIKGGEDPFRKHHTSSITRDIWLYKTIDKSFSQIINFQGEDRNPVFASNDKHFYFLSEREGSFNIFKSSVSNPEEISRISSYEKHPVRYLSIANDGTLCYSFNGEIYTLNEGKEPKKIDILIIADEVQNHTAYKNVSGISEMKLSPNGKELAFVFRGEIFVSSVDGSMNKRITNTPEQERMVSFSPDGKSLIYSSERDNSWNIYKTSLNRKGEKYFMNSTILKEEVLLKTVEETFQPNFSPDGKEVAFIEERTKLKVINIETKQIRTILDGGYNYSYADGDQYYEWSPDGKWFLIEFYPKKYWFGEVGLIQSDGKSKIINLSKSGFYDTSPKWFKKGEMMIWASNKNGLKSVSNTGPVQMDVYTMFFTQKAFEEFKMTKDEFKLFQEIQEEEKKDKKEETKGKNKKGKDEKKDEKIKPIKIDFAGLTDRKAKLTIHSSRLSDAVLSSDGKYLVYFCKVEKGYDLWRTELRTKETKILSKYGKSGGSLQMDKEGKNVFVLSGGKISKVEIESGKKKAISIGGELFLDEKEERIYLYDHVSRQVKKKFHDKNLHGADWKLMTENYKKFLPYINNDYDFRDLLSELLGELNASHTGSRYYHSMKGSDQTASFAAFYDNSFNSPGLKITEIIKDSPLLRADSKIKPGVIIEKIDNNTITTDLNYYPYLNRKVGKLVLLSLFDPATNKRWEEKVKPISKRVESALLYQRWIKRNREITHKLSEGKVGYVHVRGMNDGSYRNVIDEVMGEEVNREALIVDTRFNGGGDLVDDLCTFLSGEKYMEFKGHDRIIGFESQRRWTKPSIVIMGEANYSDAHCFPAAYKDLEIGKLVGMPVPGTCTFVWWERLQNGMVFGIPNMSVTDKSGDILENKQLEPDLLIKNEYVKISSGTDQQLETAINEMLNEVKK